MHQIDHGDAIIVAVPLMNTMPVLLVSNVKNVTNVKIVVIANVAVHVLVGPTLTPTMIVIVIVIAIAIVIATIFLVFVIFSNVVSPSVLSVVMMTKHFEFFVIHLLHKKEIKK